jgi:alpha-1,3-rhamnosyltransferase
MTEDLVTVIIPVYNKVEYLQDSLNSVVNQTYSNIEIIIVWTEHSR